MFHGQVGSIIDVGFKIPTAVVMKSSILMGFRQTDCSVLHLVSVSLLLGIFFDPEGGSDMFLRNVG
jgi:hypothetical protein